MMATNKALGKGLRHAERIGMSVERSVSSIRRLGPGILWWRPGLSEQRDCIRGARVKTSAAYMPE